MRRYLNLSAARSVHFALHRMRYGVDDPNNQMCCINRENIIVSPAAWWVIFPCTNRKPLGINVLVPDVPQSLTSYSTQEHESLIGHGNIIKSCLGASWRISISWILQIGCFSVQLLSHYQHKKSEDDWSNPLCCCSCSLQCLCTVGSVGTGLISHLRNKKRIIELI